MRAYCSVPGPHASSDMSFAELEAGEKHLLEKPYDRASVERFCRAYEALPKPGAGGEEFDARYRMTYLILKYLNEEDGWRCLEEIGDRYDASGKHYLAHLCYMEGLRSSPSTFRGLDKARAGGRKASFDHPEAPAPPGGMVSVIMGTYNRPSIIAESIRSVLAQTFGNYELIVINDGGTDEVEKVVRSFGSAKIRYGRLSANRGHAAVLNEGIRRAAGKYIAYLDDDDVYYPRHLEGLHDAISSGNGRFVYSNVRFVDGYREEGRFRPQRTRHVWRREHDRNRLLDENYIANLGVIHEKALFSEVGTFSEDLNMVMDWEFWLRASLACEFRHLDAETCEYRLDGTNITSTNRMNIDFLTGLVRNYYAGYRGRLACMQHLLHRGMKDEAAEEYRIIKDTYAEYFKHPVGLRGLLDVARGVGDRDFSEVVLLDFFRLDARGCLRYVNGAGSARMYADLLPLLPGKVLTSIRKRIPWGATD